MTLAHQLIPSIAGQGTGPPLSLRLVLPVLASGRVGIHHTGLCSRPWL